MSKGKKVTIIVAFCCIATGILLTVGAFAMLNFDFSKLNNENFKTNTYEIDETFSDITINDVECDLRLLKSTDGKCKVVCTESDDIVNYIEVENDTLIVKRTDNRPWYDHVGIWWGNNLNVSIYLPQDTYNMLYLKSVSGDIYADEGFTFSEATALSTSGDITFNSNAKDSLVIKSTSGDIISHSKTAGKATVKTTSGEIEISNMTCNEIIVYSTSGDIELSSVTVAGNAECKAVSGDIELDYCDAATLDLKTTSGEINGTLMSPKNFITSTVSGDIKVPASQLYTGDCYIKTTSGDVKVNIAE